MDIRDHAWFGVISTEKLLKKKIPAPWVPNIKDPLDAQYLILTGMWRMSHRQISLSLVLISRICSETFEVCLGGERGEERYGRVLFGGGERVFLKILLVGEMMP